MKKLHMGTVSYGFDSMDEVSHQLAVAFGSVDKGNVSSSHVLLLTNFYFSSQKSWYNCDWRPAGHERTS
jgi:hypothetical protein